MDKIDIYVIVVTYNGEKWIEKCINSVLASDADFRLIIIDNGSTDNTISIIQSFDSNLIELIQTGENLGFGKANNIGIKKAIENNIPFVYLLNQDAYIQHNTLSQLIVISRKFKEYGILSPIQMNHDYSKLDFNFEYNCSPERCPNFLSDLYTKQINEVYDINFAMAAHWFVPTTVFKNVGMFAPLFYHYGEDNDFVNRLHYAKLKVGICSDLRVVHDREFRASTNEKKIRMNYIYFLVKFADLNSSSFQKIVFLVDFFLSTVKYTFKFKSFLPFKYLLKIFKSSLQIRNHLKSHRLVNNNFYLNK